METKEQPTFETFETMRKKSQILFSTQKSFALSFIMLCSYFPSHLNFLTKNSFFSRIDFLFDKTPIQSFQFVFDGSADFSVDLEITY